jgi:carboxypeptidase Taq
MKNAYEQLSAHFREVGDLQHVYDIASWDEAAMMPTGGGEARGQAMATLGVVIHNMATDERVGQWMDSCSNLDLSQWEQANLREVKRQYDNATCIPVDLVRASSVSRSNCEQAWRVARAENDWATMEPLLTEVVSQQREISCVRAEKLDLSVYNAMLESFEPGMRSEKVDELFAGLKTFLPDFVDDVLVRQQERPLISLGDKFSVEKQRQLGLRVMGILGFDFDHGRLDVSHHPFCGGVQEDVRITTRYSENNFVESLMAVIHETGHAMYEQGRPAGMQGQPVGEARSSGVHESQSLMMEMQACRSREFMHFLSPVLREVFETSEDDPAWSNENLHNLYTRVDRGLIRVDADEVTYPLHVILRYELEKGLIEESLEVSDIPDFWNESMMKYLQRDTRGDYRNGCLQDVHWPAGLFGYFPTYTLGAMMAAQLFGAAKRTMPDVLTDIGSGDFSGLLDWLRTNVHSKGSLLSVQDLLVEATGEELNESFFVEHLKARYG